jgi:hypothetical protein
VVNNDLKNNKKSTILTTPLSPSLPRRGEGRWLRKRKVCNILNNIFDNLEKI